MECMYCGASTINYPMSLVRKAVKPKHTSHRWEKIGYCCDECEAKGNPTEIEYGAEDDAKSGGFCACHYRAAG